MTSNNAVQLARVDSYNRNLVVINIIGFILSLYSHHVSVSKKAESGYKAMCDISESMSCSRVLTSPYSSGFGILGKFIGETSAYNLSNSVIGMFYYPLLGILGLGNSKSITKLHLILAILSNIGSMYLATILVILRDFCLVCALIYVVNAFNLLLVYKKVQLLKTRFQKKKE